MQRNSRQGGAQGSVPTEDVKSYGGFALVFRAGQ